MEVISTAVNSLIARVQGHVDFLATPHPSFAAAETLFWPWLVQFVMSWVGFTTYMVWDYKRYKEGTLEHDKLPSRHPVHAAPVAVGSDGRIPFLGGLVRLSPFWYAQLFMVPLVLFNQLVVWPLVSLLVVWPQWAQNRVAVADWPGGWAGILGSLLGLMFISDQMWYWSHRLMHTPWCWKNLHRMHHIAPQCAISATYVHALEYVLFCVAMQLPYAVTGFPLWVHAVPLGWGMMTGSGAHSGYSGEFANGDKHNAHHYYHNVNFGLLMIADMIFGTHWSPGDPAPQRWSEAEKIWAAFPDVHGSEEASTFVKPESETKGQGSRGSSPKKSKTTKKTQ
jgi:sterol desaturase/sphingolipid hydroxylase (fatty acid hydroxylase superfamily)